MTTTKIIKFTDIIAWKEAHKLVLLIYRFTKNFPPEEKFGIIDQMRRAAISITSNIAEGFGRLTPKDKVHFYIMAQSSLREIENQCITSRDLNYLPSDQFQILDSQIDITSRLLTGLCRATRNLKWSVE